MKVSVQVKIKSKKESVEVLPDGTLLVRVNTPPVDGKANARVIELLAEHFKVPRSRIQLISGPQSRKKVFEVG